MTVITLTTDFGSGDHEAGVLKGVIWQITPETKVVDLSHDISRHNIMEAAILLWRAAPYFPAGTIHVVVVDPGVGTSRRGIAAHLGDQFFVGPDNGLITLLLSKTEESAQISEFVVLDQPRFWLSTVSSVFHGRDVFSPVAAHLASGTPFSMVGTQVSNPVRLNIPKPARTRKGWLGQVIHVDHFGNLSTNLNASHLNLAGVLNFSINGEQISGIVSTFGDRPVGSLIALLDSSGSLAISVVNGSAAQFLHAGIGDNIEVIFQ
jgi:hypothetical protein